MGRTLALAHEHAAAAFADGLAFVELATSRVTRVPMAGVVDMALVGDDELWVAGGAPLHLHRFRLEDARRIGQPTPLHGIGNLVPGPTRAPCALWSATPPTIFESSEQATNVSVVLRTPSDADFVLPITGSRWVTCRRHDVTLRERSSERWTARSLIGAGRIVDGAVLFDGASAALVVAQGGALKHVLVVSLHNGAVQQRVTLIEIERIRFAPVRGFGLFVASDRMVVFDLRFARVVKEHASQRAIIDAALDPAGQTFVLRHGSDLDDIVFGSVRDLIHERVQAAPNDLVEPAIEIEAPAPTEEPRGDFHRGHPPLGPVPGLAGRFEHHIVESEQAIALLECHGAQLTAQVAFAIARGWDTGRLAFPNESPLPFRGEVTGILGESSGRAREEVQQAERRLARSNAALAEATARIGADVVAPLAALAAELGLSAVAQKVLIAVAGPLIWGDLARLYGVLGNDAERPLVDEMLVIQILTVRPSDGITRIDVARELERGAPLVRHGLVRISDGRARPFAALQIEPVVLQLLRGERDIELAEVVTRSATQTFEDLLIPASVKAAIVTAIADSRPSPHTRIVVRGRTGSGRHTLLATLAATTHRKLGVIDTTPLLSALGARIGELRSALTRAQLNGLLPCIDGLERLPADDRAGRDLLAHVLDEHPGPLAIRLAPDARPPIAPGYIAIDLPALSPQQRSACWQTVLRTHDLYVRDATELADRFGVGPGVIHRVCELVAEARPAAVSVEPTEPTDRTVALDAAIRQYLESGLGATATRVTRLASWSRVVLPPDVQDSVLELIARIKHRRTVYDTWGYDRLLTTARGVTALFQGGPGTGKTLVAGAIANELGMDMYRVDLSRIMSKWIGETEQNLAKLFDAAEDGHAIILFDEADSLFAKRTEVKSSVDRYANLEVNYLLQRLDTFEGIAILTTNFGTSIDNAFKRRLSFRLTFPFPDEEAREALWRAHIASNIPKSGEFDFGDLARRYRLSGGYIRNAALRAAFLAAGEQTPLTHDHLVRAIQAEFREIGKIAESGVLE